MPAAKVSAHEDEVSENRQPRVGFAVSEAFVMTHRDQPLSRSPNHAPADLTSRVVRIFPLDRPQSFLASLRGAGLQEQEFRLHHRSLLETERQALFAQHLWQDAARSDEVIRGLTASDPSGPRGACAGRDAARRACVLGFVLPKRMCKHAVRRNLIRRVMREGLRKHLLQAPDWPLEPPVLVLKLSRKLPETFTSAKSRLLGIYVRQQLQALLRQYSARLARQALVSGSSHGLAAVSQLKP
jgi:ribonuclease P protein component